MKALIVGGTGATGPDIVAELLERSYAVTILHRGIHEPDEPVLGRVEHLHADPHFAESITECLGERTFDVIVGGYGRLKVVAKAAEGRCGQFIAIGGNLSLAGMANRYAVHPSGLRVFANEQDPLVDDDDQSARGRFARKVALAEEAVFEAHHRGAYSASYLRYPIVYGKRTFSQFDKGIIRRLLDGRKRIPLPDGGLGILTRCAAANAARHVALAVDRPDAAAGQVFECGDSDQFSLAQLTEMIAAVLDRPCEIVSVSMELARSTWGMLPSGPVGSAHAVYDLTKARTVLGYADVIPARRAITELVEHLAADPSLAEVTYDAAGEDVVLGAYDDAVRAVSSRLGWEPFTDDRYFSGWHAYDHPKAPDKS